MARDWKRERKRVDSRRDWTPGEASHQLGPSHKGSNIRPKGLGGATAYPKAKQAEAGPPGTKRRRR